MTTPLEELLNRSSGKAVPETTTPQVQPEAVPQKSPLEELLERSREPTAEAKSPLQELLDRSTSTGTPVSQTPAQPTANQEVEREWPVADDGTSIQAPAGDAPRARTGFGQTLLDSVERGARGIASGAVRFGGVLAEAQGDVEGAQAYETSARAIDEAGPKAQVESLKDVKGLEDFVYWAAERAGEQVPILASIVMTGGVGGLVSNLVARGVLSSAAARGVLTRFGATAAPTAAMGAIETGDTAQEQFSVTGRYNPGVSLAAGAAKGALEMVVPFALGKSILGRGAFSSTIPRAIGKGALLEGATEGLQAEVDIGARKYSDPNYSYFGSEANWRRADSVAAGMLVGGPMAGVAQAVSPPPGPREITLEEAKGERPILDLWGKFFGGNKRVTEDRDLAEILRSDPGIDAVTAKDLIGQIGPAWTKQGARTNNVRALLEFVEKNTERYLVPGRGQELLNATDAEGALAQLPNDLKPRIIKVNQGSLVPAAITARWTDLPLDEKSDRIYFLPGTTAEEKAKLLERYRVNIPIFKSVRDNELREQGSSLLTPENMQETYGSLLDGGLRVLPNPGASFNYTAEMTGEEVREPTHARSMAIAKFKDGKFGTFKAPQDYGTMLGFVTGAQNYSVAVNTDMIKEGDIIPMNWAAIDWRSGPIEVMRDADKRLSVIHDDFMSGRIDAEQADEAKARVFEGAINAGLKVKMDQVIDFRLRSGVDVTHALVPGVGNPSPHRQSKKYIEGSANYQPKKPLYAETHFNETTAKNGDPSIAKSIREFIPFVKRMEKILKVFPVKIEISTDQTTNAAGMYNHEKNTITIYPRGSSIERLDTLLHEYGHHVTVQWWMKLPEDLQQQIWIGYQRNLVAHRYNKEAGNRITGWTNAPNDGWYFQSFIEYQAEQFRRWASSDTFAVSEMEAAFKDGAEQIKRLFTEAKAKYGEKRAKEWFYPDYTFAEWMTYIQQRSLRLLGSPHGDARYIRLGLQEGTGGKTTEELVGIVEGAILEHRHLFPKSWNVSAGDAGMFQSGESNAAVAMPDKQAVVIGLGALEFGVKGVITHEAVHASEALFTDLEWQTLVREAKTDPRQVRVIDSHYKKVYRTNLDRLVTEGVITKEEAEVALQHLLDAEYVAFMMQAKVNGKPYIANVNQLIQRFIELLQRIYSKMMGRGWVDAEAIMSDFLLGKIAKRDEEAWLDEYRIGNVIGTQAMIAFDRGSTALMVPDRVQRAWEGVSVAVQMDKGPSGKGVAQFRFFEGIAQQVGDPVDQLRTLGQEVGHVFISQNAKGWEVDTVWVRESERGTGVAKRMYQLVERDLKTKMKPSGILSDDGYAMWKRRDATRIRYHVYDSAAEWWYSPNYIQKKHNYYTGLLSRMKTEQKLREVYKEDFVRNELRKWEQLKSKVSDKAWLDPELDSMFHIGRHGFQIGTSEAIVEQDRLHREDVLMQQLDMQNGAVNVETSSVGMDPPVSTPTDIKPQPENLVLRSMARNIGANDPATRRVLTGVIEDRDRIGFWSRWVLGLHQIVWRNPHVTWLRQHLGLAERMSAEQMKWVSIGDNTIREWDKIKDTHQKAALAEMFFWATEMNYRTPQEVAQKVVRHPTQAELSAYMTANRITPETYTLYQRAMGDFQQALTKTEEISRLHILQRTQPGSQERLKAEAELTAEMQKLRAKPYFPLVRFGDWVVTARDAQTGDVTGFYAFATARERDAHARDIKRQNPFWDVTIDRMRDDIREFMGLPSELLQLVKTLPGITPDQVKWIDQLAMVMAPERSFRKRWLERKGTEGYSRDAMRAYSHYFNSFAGYISKLQYKPALEENIAGFKEDNKRFGDATKRSEMVMYLQEHLKYILSPSRDWMHLRAGTTAWYLGASPIAAGMNLTQNLMVTWPYLSKLFGVRGTNGAMLSARQWPMSGGLTANHPRYPGFKFAYEEAIRQGKIDTGQASDLASYAEGDNLLAASAGTKAQRRIRQLMHVSMMMFAATERYNRKITFGAAFQLAMQDTQNAHVREIAQIFDVDINRLISEAQTAGAPLTYDEAVAFFVARETLDRTQFMFAPYARPQMSRNPIMANVLIFTQYLQGYIFALAQNPGHARALLMLFALYGLMGLPGMEDFFELIKAISRRMFGKNWDPEKELRRYILQVAEGSIFEEVAPDLFLHGLSRGLGYSIGALSDEKLPLFDLHMNGSMGKLIPGMAEGLKAWGTYQDFHKVQSKVTNDMAGAGFGYAMALSKFLTSEPFSADYKQWEKVLPRSLKAASRAVRYGVTGKETYPSGATFATFDWKDPEDMGTLIAQFLGASPMRLTQKWDAIGMTKEARDFWVGRKAVILKQLDVAVQDGSPAVLDHMFNVVIPRYNKDLAAEGLETMSITKKSLAGLRQRARGRQLDELGLPRQRNEIPLNEQTKEVFPRVEWSKPVK